MSMASSRALLAIGTVVALHCARAVAADPSVEVFTLSTLPVTNARNAIVHYLDAIVLLEQRISAGLPPDPARAQQLVTRRMAALGPELDSRAATSMAGLARAAQLGVQRAPAIVFDGKWVVHGVTDVDAARRIFAAHLSGGSR